MKTWFALIAMVISLAIVSLAVGPGEIGVRDAISIVFATLWATIGAVVGPAVGPIVHDIGYEEGAESVSQLIVWQLRFPRILMALLSGAMLGLGGAVTQGFFRNPLAEPGLLGISSGAAVAAVLGLVFGLGGSTESTGVWWTLPLLASLGALITLTILFLLAYNSRSVTTLLLMGVALNFFCGAVVALLLSVFVDRWEVGQQVMQWLMGSFEGRSWQHLQWLLPSAIVGGGLAAWLHRDLDLLHLGEESAHTLGMNSASVRIQVVLCAGILAGGVTAAVGVIGFVGLLVPHGARFLVGSEHKKLLPASALLGALLMLAIDCFSRSVSVIALPPGVITSLLGAPLLIILLQNNHLSSGAA